MDISMGVGKGGDHLRCLELTEKRCYRSKEPEFQREIIHDIADPMEI